VNLVGEEIALDVWKNERKFFSRGKYRGIAGKVDYLFSLFPNVALKKGEEPYQTFRRLKITRDNLAHNRVYRFEEVTEGGDPTFVTKWDEFDTPEKVEASLARLKELAEMIRVEAVKLLKEDYKLSHLHYRAFQGPLGSSSGERKAEVPAAEA